LITSINSDQNKNIFDSFDNIYLNKLIAYLSIINSLNYKWYKSSKRRFLIPNFYFTKFFYNFLKVFFLKNTFRKKIQISKTINFLNPVGFFSKKMFFNDFLIKNFLETNNIYYFFLKKSNLMFFRKSNYFFKSNYFLKNVNSSLFINNKIALNNINVEDTFLFDKKLNFFENFEKNNLDLFFYFNLFNSNLIEIYKIIILNYYKNLLYN